MPAVAFWNREKREEKRAREGQAQEEIDRLQGLGPEQLAAEILPVLGSDDLKRKLTGARVQEISKGMLDGFGSSMRVNPGVLLIPIKEGLQRLEHANLVMQMASSNVDSSSRWRITKAGEEALAAGDAAAKLAAS
jgi:hypothetical protein